MEDMHSAVTLPLIIGGSHCDNAMEITQLNLITGTARLIPDPKAASSEESCPSDSDHVHEAGLIITEAFPRDAKERASESSTELNSGDDPVLEPTNDHAAKEMRSGRIMFSRPPLWGHDSVCGRRSEMEDAFTVIPFFSEIPSHMLKESEMAHFFGVYDGHGGAQVANYCRNRMHIALMEEIQKNTWETALTNSFLKIDAEIGGTAAESSGYDEPIAPDTVGSTAIVAVICSSEIIIASCGDSRAVLSRGKEALPLSNDHKPDREDERNRIEAAGGRVINWGGYRVSGVLAMSRSIGDWHLKPWIISNPEITRVARTKEDNCLILATDGLWDVMTNEEACAAARKMIISWHRKNGGAATPPSSGGAAADPAAQAAAEYLTRLAHQKGSADNITVIVIDLRPHRRVKARAVNAME